MNPGACRAPNGRLLTRQVVAEGRPRPARLVVPQPRGMHGRLSLPAVPSTCPKRRFAEAADGQHRSADEVAEQSAGR
jgi:hypothetical protein